RIAVAGLEVRAADLPRRLVDLVEHPLKRYRAAQQELASAANFSPQTNVGWNRCLSTRFSPEYGADCCARSVRRSSRDVRRGLPTVSNREDERRQPEVISASSTASSNPSSRSTGDASATTVEEALASSGLISS